MARRGRVGDARRSERGWTLPLTWFLLLSIAAVLYLGGVWVLAAIALVAVVAAAGIAVFTAGTAIYARLTAKPAVISPLRADYSLLNYRFESDLDLPTLAIRLAPALDTRQYAHDFDGGRETIRSKTPDGSLDLWLTRYVGGADDGPNEVLVIIRVAHRASAPPPDRRAFGRALVRALGTKVEGSYDRGRRWRPRLRARGDLSERLVPELVRAAHAVLAHGDVPLRARQPVRWRGRGSLRARAGRAAPQDQRERQPPDGA